MKIGIDGYEANVSNKVGIGRFAFEIIHSLARLNSKHEFVIFVPNKQSSELPKTKDTWKYRIIPSNSLWTITALPHALKTEPVDIFFSPTHYIPFIKSIPRICSIMDMSFVHFPQFFKIQDLIKLRLGTSYAAHNAKHIVTISEFSKKEIQSHYKLTHDKISVVYPGYDTKLFNEAYTKKDKQHIQKKYTIQTEYIVYVGTLQPRKNITRLIASIPLLRDKEVKLLIIGKKGWHYNAIFRKVAQLHLENRVQFVGFVPDVDLAPLIAASQAYVLPSLYEGFGIPAVEALACGVPVVVSNVSSLPEIVGDAGIYIDPYDTKSIAHGIEQALSLSNKEKDIIGAKGQKHIQKFNWDTAGHRVLRVFENAVK